MNITNVEKTKAAKQFRTENRVSLKDAKASVYKFTPQAIAEYAKKYDARMCSESIARTEFRNIKKHP